MDLQSVRVILAIIAGVLAVVSLLGKGGGVVIAVAVLLLAIALIVPG